MLGRTIGPMAAEETGEPEDPFAGWQLDESFVADAARKEESAEERLARLARIDAEHRRLQDDARREQRAARRSRFRLRGKGAGRAWLGRLAVGAVLVVVAVAVVRAVQGESAASGPFSLGGDAAEPELVVEGGRPPKSVEQQDRPIGVPAPHPESDAYEFMATQEGSTAPVAYDPCRPIHVVVNARTQPPGGDRLVAEALHAASQATGLQLVVDGPTDEQAGEQRRPYQPDRYPDRWAPVLIEWTDPAASPELAGQVAGRGGSQALAIPAGTVYVSGSVQLDGPQVADVLRRPGGRDEARAIIQHELAHLLGLDHVDDRTQLMWPEGTDVVDYAAGDLTGLDRLGRGRCFPEL
jgi:hypothetical protein